jgi:hypothetical protein
MQGMLGNLPPGMRGYLLAQQQGQQKEAQALQMAGMLAQLQGSQEDRAMKQQMMPLQLEQLQTAIAETKRKADQEVALRAARAGLFSQGNPAQGALSAGAAQGDVGPTVGNMERLQTAPPTGMLSLNPQAVQQYIAAGGTAKDIEGITNLGPMGQVGKIDPKDYTPESLAAFMQSHNPTVLRPRVKMEVGPGGQAYDPYALQPGAVMADPNKPFAIGPNGPVPNLPFQQYEVGRAKAGASKTNVNVNPMRETFKDEQALREEYTKSSGTFVKLSEGYSKVKGALAADATKSAPATLAAATQFMKLLDPESVVRESELGMALASTGMWDRFTNIYQTVMSGKVLTPKQAGELGRVADVVYNAANTAQQGRVQHFRGLAQSYNFNPDRVVPDLTPKVQRRSTDVTEGFLPPSQGQWSVVR